jgi:hypothetical protein
MSRKVPVQALVTPQQRAKLNVLARKQNVALSQLINANIQKLLEQAQALTPGPVCERCGHPLGRPS